MTDGYGRENGFEFEGEAFGGFFVGDGGGDKVFGFQIIWNSE